ncbi:MAG: hypothetical protein AAF268_07435 [Cyanobacteria bacterium P01_A01_bin.3]
MRIDPAGHRKVDTLTAVKDFFQQHFADSTDQLKLPDEDVQRQLVAMMRVSAPPLADSSPTRSPLSARVFERTSLAPLADLESGSAYSVDRLAQMAEVCLRCYISNAIEQVCVQLEGQFGGKHGFTRHNLFPFVLDAGTPLRQSRRSARVGYQSVTDSILKTYDPHRGSLTTWTVRLVRRNRELNGYLLECGVYLISDWAILNDTSPRQLKRVLSEFHTLTDTEIRDASQLLDAYHSVYRRDRMLQRQAGPVGRCAQPSTEQLLRMAACLRERSSLQNRLNGHEPLDPPPTYDAALDDAELDDSELDDAALAGTTPASSVGFEGDAQPLLTEPPRLLAQLQQLAERLRQYRIHVRGGPSLATESLEGNGAYRAEALLATSANGNELQEEYGEFIEYYHEQFSSCMDLAIADTIERWVTTMQRKKSSKHQQFLQALSLFHDRGMSMGDIAPLVGLKAQYQVSRLLKLKELRADIRQSLLLALRDRVKLQAERYHSDIRDLQEVDRQIEAVLSEQVDDVLYEAAAEASVAQKTVPNRSLYTRRLCQYLQTRSQES